MKIKERNLILGQTHTLFVFRLDSKSIMDVGEFGSFGSNKSRLIDVNKLIKWCKAIEVGWDTSWSRVRDPRYGWCDD